MILLLILVSMLDCPRWWAREAATRALTPANTLTLPLLEWIEEHGSVEAGRRARRINNQWYEGNAARLSHQVGKMPWIDSSVVGNACEWLELTRNYPAGSDWLNYREATRLIIESKIRCRQPYAQLLKNLWAAELHWRLEHWYWK